MLSQKKMDLFERLRRKIGNSSVGALTKRIQRRARELGIPTGEAIFVLAKENKVGYLNDLNKLPREIQAKINSAIISTANVISPRKGLARRTQTGTTILKTRFGIIHEPLLPKSIKGEAKLMAEKSYLSLYIFENSLRNFIKIIMDKKYGPDWWPQQMGTKKLKGIVNKVEKRMEEEEKIAWHGKRGAHFIFYSDFGDLANIIKTHEKIFRPYFKNQKVKTNWLLSKMYEIEPSRNVTAHHNPLSDKDLSRVHGNLMDWLAQLKYLRSHNLL